MGCQGSAAQEFARARGVRLLRQSFGE